MSQFGGWAQFGGHTKFGGALPLAKRIYRIAKGLLVPGFWSDDDAKRCNLVLRAEAKLLAEGQVHADRLFAEGFPHTADEDLPDWGTFLGVVFPAAATLAEKQAAVVARWRGHQGSSLPELREMLYPILQPARAFADDMDDGGVSSRYDLSGNGSRAESGTSVVCVATGTVDCDWLAGNANLATYRLHDIADGFTWRVEVSSHSLAGTGTAVGLVVLGDADNAVMLAVGDNGAGSKLRVDQVVEGTLTEDVGAVQIAAPTAPYYLQCTRSASVLALSYGTDPDALTTLLSLSQPVAKLRSVGWFARNETATKNAASIGVDSVRLVHAKPEANVEIVEQRESNCDLAGDATQIFLAYVHRASEDPGSYSITEAQRLLDKCKQGHTLILAGERCEFRCDDLESLCDRDILGRV